MNPLPLKEEDFLLYREAIFTRKNCNDAQLWGYTTYNTGYYYHDLPASMQAQ